VLWHFTTGYFLFATPLPKAVSTNKFSESRKVSSLIKDVTPFNETDWADFLDISTKSLQRYKQRSKQFKPIQSEKIIELAEVTNVGKNVFGSIEKFKLWLETPNFALGNMKPKELLKDSYGKEMVIGELTRIEHGIFV
jgi:putative toxin-antitoxin system antitoxin component (TIGR02293 family)